MSTMAIPQDDMVDYENIPTNAQGRPTTTTRRRTPSRRRRSALSTGLWAVVLLVAVGMGVIHFRESPSAAAAIDNANTADAAASPVVDDDGADDDADSADMDVPSDANAANDSAQPDDGTNPQVAWIMSFGGSGTSYTITNTEHMTGLTTATNYARDIVPSIPVHEAWTDGPFVHDVQLQRPEHYILTKTHCGGYCMDCPPQTYVYENVADFEQACLTSTSVAVDDATGEEQVRTTIYASSIPKRVIHLVRDPFDNLVGRMHLADKLSAKREGVENKEFENSQQGFYEWCAYLDDKYADLEAESTTINHAILEAFQDLPCHAEWYRYVQWHNYALEVRDELQIPSYNLFYENYTLAYDETIGQMFDFLEMKAIHSPLEFYSGKTYRSFFKPEDAKLAGEFTKEFASPRVWEMLEHYFVGFDNGDDDDSTVESEFNLEPRDPNQVTQTVEGDRDDDSEVDNMDGKDSAMETSNSNEGANVVWLLSFPNSGTSYTITNTERISNMSTASNYASDWDELVPVRPELTNGPFLHNLNMKVPELVLTKTHCTGYCSDCPPSQYVLESVEAFQEGCRSVDAKVDGKVARLIYDASVPAKAIHLIRDPFDNLVARLHLSLKHIKEAGAPTEELEAYTEGRDGLLAWCNYIDNKFADEDNDTDLIRPKIKGLLKDVPCHAEWFRYVQWHNLALEMTSQMELPVFYLHYEKYGQHYNKAVSDIFQFLNLSPVRDPIEFIAGKHYADYYTVEEQQAAARLVKELASLDCWELIKSYFDGLLDE